MILSLGIVANASGTMLTCEVFIDDASFQQVPSAGQAFVVESKLDNQKEARYFVVVAQSEGSTLASELKPLVLNGKAIHGVYESLKDDKPLFGMIITRDEKTKKIDGATLQYYNPNLLISTCE